MVNCPGTVISFNKKLNPDSLTPELLYLYLYPQHYPFSIICGGMNDFN